MGVLKIFKSDNTSTRQAKKRFKNKLKRKNIQYPRKHVPLGPKDEIQYKKSPIKYGKELENFCKVNHLEKWRKSKHEISLDKDFCFFNNPDRVLRSLLEMLHDAKHLKSYAKINYIDYTSFGAMYFIDSICWEIAKSKKWELKHPNLPIEDRIMLSQLRSIVSSVYENEKAYMIHTRVVLNRSDDKMAEQKYRVRSKEITDMVEQAIKEQVDEKYELDYKIGHAITSTIGEHFDNILLHAPEAEFGVLCGYYNKSSGEITILIYNFGKTIAETLMSKELPLQMKTEIESIIENHKAKKFFFAASPFSSENAMSLLALQEGISSRIFYDKSRGNGLIDYIENCFAVSDKARISIISGRTAIKIDKKYKTEIKNVLGRNRRILALNENNDIFLKPDENYVRSISIHFPGVIIETTIPLNELI